MASDKRRDPSGVFDLDAVVPPLPDEEPKTKPNGAPNESVSFLIPMQCATTGHDPLEDEFPMMKNGAVAGVVMRFCKTCKMVYWYDAQTR